MGDSSVDGARVAVRVAASQDTVDATSAPAPVRSSRVAPLIVAASMPSLNVAAGRVVRLCAVAPAAGTTALTTGAPASAAYVAV